MGSVSSGVGKTYPPTVGFSLTLVILYIDLIWLPPRLRTTVAACQARETEGRPAGQRGEGRGGERPCLCVEAMLRNSCLGICFIEVPFRSDTLGSFRAFPSLSKMENRNGASRAQDSPANTQVSNQSEIQSHHFSSSLWRMRGSERERGRERERERKGNREGERRDEGREGLEERERKKDIKRGKRKKRRVVTGAGETWHPHQ